MKTKYIRYYLCTLSLSLAAFQMVTGQTPTPVPTPFVAPPLPQIGNYDKPNTLSVDPAKLPPPFHTESARRGSRVIPQPAGAKLFVPKGFKINVFAEGEFRYPRWMALAPNGDVFVADSRANSVVVLRDTNNDGKVRA